MLHQNSIVQSDAVPTYGTRISTDAYIGGAVSGFRLYWNGGANFAAQGKVRVYGYQNS